MTPGCVIVLTSHKDTGPLFEEKISPCAQFNLKKESLLREFTELKQQLRFGPLQSCFSASTVVGF